MTGSKQGPLRSVLWSLMAMGVMAAAGVAVVGVSSLLGYLSGLALVPGFMAIVLGTGLLIAGLIEGGRRGVPGLEADGVVMVRGLGFAWCVRNGLYWVFTSRARWRREPA